MMAKILKHLVFGQKKNPPAPPRPDYEGEKCPKDEFSDHDYENIQKYGAAQKKEVAFQEKKKPELVVFENYSEPADLIREIISNNTYENDDCDPLYMSPVDDATPSWTKNEEEDMYCVPYEDAEDVPQLPSPCMGPGVLTHRYGRKTVLMLTSTIFASSWLMIAYADSVSWICAGRVISGFCTGLFVVAVPAYVAEIAPQNIRGKLSSGFPFAVNFGILVVMSLGLILRWSWLAISIVIVTAIASCMMVFMPESPVWLVRESRLHEAACALRFFYGKSFNYKAEIDKMVKVIRSEKQDNPVTMKDLTNPIFYKPLLISVGMMVFHTTAGLGPLQAYTVEIFKRAGSVDPDVAAIVFAVVQIIATIACGFIIDNFGRRKLYMLSGAGTSIVLFCLSIYSYMQQYHPVKNSAMGYIPLLCFSLCAFIFAIGIGSIPFVMIPEMVSVQYRSTVLSLSLVCAALCSFTINKSYNNLRNLLCDYGLYSLFGFLTMLSVVFSYFVLPETKKLSFETISKNFMKPNNEPKNFMKANHET